MRSFAIALTLSLLFPLLFSGASLAGEAVYVLDTPQLSCSYTSAEAKSAVEGIDNVNFVSSDKSGHTLTVSLDTNKTTIAKVIDSLADAGQDVSSFRKFETN